MKWDRSETIALAKVRCTLCHGYGLRTGCKGKRWPCNCVLRAIFRACYERFQRCATYDRYLSRVTPELCQGKDYKRNWARKNEDYLADFCLVSQQALNEQEYKIFRFHLLLGADWKLCCRKLQIDRGTFFHAVYRIEEKLGRVFRELEPYSLFPLDEYFASTNRNPAGSLAIFPARAPGHHILRPPLQKSA